MRFGRRTRNPLSWKRRPKAQNDEGETEFHPVASEERDALLAGETPPNETLDEPPDMSDDVSRGSPGEHEPPVDPTQRLLTALGRFQRQVARAREGLPQEAWAEQCMNQLIVAVEIALEQGWRELVNALTETARILQSYEDAGQANRAAAFLADSNELLCLMVGDLIVGRIRPGVVDKWRQRYERALKELDEADIPLVMDEEGAGVPARSSGYEAAPEAQPSDADRSDQDRYEDISPLEPLAELEEEPVSGPTEAVGVTDGESPQSAEQAGETPPSVGEVVGEIDELDRAVEALIGDLAVDRDSAARKEGAETIEGVSSLEEVPPWSIDEAARAMGVTGRRDLPAEVVSTLDALCDNLARLAEDPKADVRKIAERLEEDVAALHEHARVQNRESLLRPCEVLTGLVQMIGAGEAVPDDRFLELAYAFCGLYGESSAETDDAQIASWLSECEALGASWHTAPVKSAGPETEAPKEEEVSAEPEEPAVPEVAAEEEEYAPVLEEPPPVEEETPAPLHPLPPLEDEWVGEEPRERDELEVPEEGKTTPEGLLATAQKAFGEGNLAKAKLLALEAAAKLAEAQTSEAETLVERAEDRLKKGAAEAEQARDRVRRIEQQVAEAERRVAEMFQEAERARETVAKVSGAVTATQQRIESIEEQIRALEALRTEAIAQKVEAESRLAEADASCKQIETGLSQSREEENQARIRLEDARQQVKALERKRLENDAAVEKAREILNRRRASLAEIEQTIAQIGGAEQTDSETEKDLLF